MYIEKTFAQKIRSFLIFAAFPLFAFTTVLVIPFLIGVFLSFTDWNGIQPIDSFGYHWIGFSNFINALTDPTYINTLGMTFAYVILVVGLTNVIAFLVAMLVTSNLPARNFFRAAFFVPNLIGGVILGFIWQFIFSTFIQRVGDITGIPALQYSWLVETDKAFIAMVVVGVWQLSGYMMLIYIAGLVGISQEVLEASTIDGASSFQQMLRIKIPLMIQAFTVSIFLTLRNSFMVFDVNLSLTKGGPFHSTEMATLHIYNEAFISQHFGTGQAQAIILFVIVAVVATTQVIISKRLEKQGAMKYKRMGGLIVAIFLAVIYLFPFAIVLMNSFKRRVDILRDPLSLPTSLDFSNYTDAFTRMNYTTSFVNTLIITLLSIIVLTIFPSMLAYYLSRFENRATKVIFVLLVVSMIVPFQALMIPFASIYGRLNLLNNRWSLIFFYLGFGVSLSTFLYHGFIRTIPIALDESAAIEGANKFQIFWKVIFPILLPTTATIIILNTLWIWNDYLLPSLVLFINDRTLPLTTYSFYGQYTSDYGAAMAGLILSIMPVILFYLFMQRNILKGIAEGAVK